MHRGWEALCLAVRTLARMNQIFGRLTAFVGVAALGVLAGVAITAPGPTTTASLREAAPVEVRTQVIRRTVRVVRHVRPPPAPAPAVQASAPAVAPAARPAVSRAAPPRLTTRSSGSSGGGEGDDGEREGGGDD